MSRWDKGVDYITVYRLLVNRIKKGGTSRSRCYDSILLIQLRNGLRVSESVRAYKQYLLTKKTEISVKISKKRKHEERMVIIPEEVIECLDLLQVDDKVLVNRIKSYASGVLKINTHSLRYAFITHLLRNGVNPVIISKILKHSKLDFILTYTQEKAAANVLKDYSLF